VTCPVDFLKMGQCEVPGPEVYWMSAWHRWETLYFWAFLIRGGGNTVLINTGPPRDLTELNAVWREVVSPRSQMIRQNEELIEAQLARFGMTLDHVDHVLITPLQAYATAKIPLFRNALICLSAGDGSRTSILLTTNHTCPGPCAFPMTCYTIRPRINKGT
jgi:hypothetical protein